MLRSFYRYSFVIAILFLAACSKDNTGADDNDGLSAFSADSLRQHNAELSYDAFTGRKPFSEGDTKTNNYMIDH